MRLANLANLAKRRFWAVCIFPSASTKMVPSVSTSAIHQGCLGTIATHHLLSMCMCTVGTIPARSCYARANMINMINNQHDLHPCSAMFSRDLSNSSGSFEIYIDCRL
jgi:hypothetical protein